MGVMRSGFWEVFPSATLSRSARARAPSVSAARGADVSSPLRAAEATRLSLSLSGVRTHTALIIVSEILTLPAG